MEIYYMTKFYSYYFIAMPKHKKTYKFYTSISSAAFLIYKTDLWSWLIYTSDDFQIVRTSPGSSQAFVHF